MSAISLRERLLGWVPPWLGWTLATSAAVVLLLYVGRAVPTQPTLALLVAGLVLVTGLTAVNPATIPLLALPLFLVVARVGAGGVDVSVSDVALAAAFVPAVLLAPRPYLPEMRTILWLSFGYQVATLFTVIANPYTANTVEWLHTWLLVSGGLVVGWALGRQGYAAHALSLMLLTGAALAVIAVVQGVQQVASGDFGPVYASWPYGMHKNFLGPVLAFLAMIAYVHPDWMRWSRRWALGVFWLLVAGLAFTQSRQAMITLGVTLLVIVLRRDSHRSRSKIILIAVPAVAAFVATTINDQIASGNRHNSLNQRLTWFTDSMAVWDTNPLLGAGLRWWYTDRFDTRFQPPNGTIELLTTAGVVGLAGFAMLLVGAFLVMWRLEPRWGTLPAAMFVGLLVQSQMDGFWQAVRPALPFLVAGIALGALALTRTEHEVADSLAAVTAAGGDAVTDEDAAGSDAAQHEPVGRS